jgi:DNA-binding MarR family transcriptional regulator
MTDSVPNRQHVVKQPRPRRSRAGDAFTDFLMRVFPLNSRLTAAGEALAKPAGQSLARWVVLETIEEEPATVAAVARRLGLARQGVQRLADRLVADGLASYEDNPRHRRARLLRITPAGIAAVREIQEAQRDWADRVGAEIGEDELERASAMLDRVLEVVTRERPSQR